MGLTAVLAAPSAAAVAVAHGIAQRPADIAALVDKYALKYGIPLHIARNLVRVESGGRQDARSPSGARGVMQLMPQTARALGVDIDDPEQNIEGGMRYLRHQYDRFGRWDLAVAAYHAGPAAVQRSNGVPPRSQAFVSSVLGTPPTSAARGPSSGAAAAGHRLGGGLSWPVSGMLTARFSGRHRGIDLAAPAGTPIRAARGGTVAYAGRYYDYGQTVILDHGGGIQTLYGHTSAILVRPGQAVQTGQVIARVGCSGRCSGPHVHFEVRVNGVAVDPLKEMPAAAGRPARPRAAPAQTSARTEEVDLASGRLITTVTDTVQDGQVAHRVETILFILEGGMRILFTREYRRIGGVLVLVREEAEVR